MIKYFLFFILIFATSTFAQEKVPYPEQDPKLTTSQELPEDLKNLVWNKWSTKNFIILSIDKSQGEYLKNNLEKIKTNLLNSWGIKDVQFKTPCKIVCVPDEKLLKRIFRLEKPKIEMKDDSCAIWFYLKNKSELPIYELMQICLFQLENNTNTKLPLFCKFGMSVLSEDLDFIRNKLANCSNNISMEEFLSKKEEYFEKHLAESCLICLMLRKEFGQDNFLNFLHKGSFVEFGINDSKKLDEIINRYRENIINDLNNNKIPDDYLIIRNNRR